MFNILVTLCLSTSPEVCVDRYMFSPKPQTEIQCIDSIIPRLEQWSTGTEGYITKSAICTTNMPVALSVEQIAPGIWVHKGLNEVPTAQNRGDLANIGFIVGEEAVAVVDAGGSAMVAEGLYAAIREITDLPVRTLILTHMHPDHTLGSPVFSHLGAEIVGHPKLGEALTNRIETYQRNISELLGPETYAGSGIVLPDRSTPPLEIDLGGRILRLDKYPTAHTDNDLTVFDVSTGTLWASDLVFAQHTPALDGSILGWQVELEQLTNLEAERLVPGHGPVSLEIPEGMGPTRDYLGALTSEVREAIQNGVSLRTAIETVGESQRSNWLLFDEFNPRNVTAAYTELEWE